MEARFDQRVVDAVLDQLAVVDEPMVRVLHKRERRQVLRTRRRKRAMDPIDS
jgi:hypothetical protein